MADLSPEQLATKQKCRNCYESIVQSMPGGKWRDTESECAVCVKSSNESPVWHAPMPSARAAMLIRRGELLKEHPEIATAGELAPLMGEHEQEFWDWVLGRLFGATGP